MFTFQRLHLGQMFECTISLCPAFFHISWHAISFTIPLWHGWRCRSTKQITHNVNITPIWLLPHLHTTPHLPLALAVWVPVVFSQDHWVETSAPSWGLLAWLLHSLAWEGYLHTTANTFLYILGCITTYKSFVRKTYRSFCTDTEKQEGELIKHSTKPERCVLILKRDKLPSFHTMEYISVSIL